MNIGKFMFRYVFIVFDTIISWKATLQKVVALLTTKVEYIALTEEVEYIVLTEVVK